LSKQAEPPKRRRDTKKSDDYVGFVFFEKSPRNLTVGAARSLATRAYGKTKIVALVVDAANTVIDDIMVQVRPDVFQLHGTETPERVAEIRRRTGTEMIKAIKVGTAADAAAALEYAGVVDLILFDAKAPSGAPLPGGNGHTFDWSAIDDVKAKVPYMLSGGLTPGNVAQAIRSTGASRVDVSSGVETSPGEKDADLIRSFITNARTQS
jgi:phosphoribosylanthranilate isomerase